MQQVREPPIDRLDSFLFSEEEASAIETDISEEAKKKRQNASVKQPGSRNFLSTEKTFENPEEELKTKVSAESASAYLEYPSKSFLHSFQNSILRMDSTLLPTEPDENDVSLRILKAPSFVREVEATSIFSRTGSRIKSASLNHPMFWSWSQTSKRQLPSSKASWHHCRRIFSFLGRSSVSAKKSRTRSRMRLWAWASS